MKIISKQKDYYDYLMQYGVDNQVVYVRNTEKINNLEKKFLELLRGKIYTFKDDYKNIESGCKTIYFGINYKMYFGLRCGYSLLNPIYIWKEDILDYTENYVQNIVDKRILRRLYDEFKNGNENYKEIFDYYNVPVFLIFRDFHFGDIILNPILKNYNLASYFPPEFIWQEIYNWLSLKPKETIEIEDKYKIEQYGFDKKYSFRNIKPSEKKQRRKLNKMRKKQK